MKHTTTIVALALAALLPVCAWAQTDVEQQKALISEVKRNNNYLFAETTMESPEKANKVVMELLNKEIADYARSNGKKFTEGQIVVARNTGSGTQTISLPRGNMYRAFAYIKKSDVLPSENITIVQTASGEATQAAGQDAASTTVSEVSTATVSTAAQTDAQPASPAIDPAKQRVVERLLQLKKAEEVLPCLNKMKREKLITEITSPTKVSNPEAYILVVYDADNNISAILHSGKPRINARTNQPDATSNYEYKGIIAVK